MKRLIVRPAAAADIANTFAWYQHERPGLGSTFLQAVRSTLGRILRRPAAYPVLPRGLRRALMGRPFPYAVYFRVHDDVISIEGCLHAKRDPRRWQVREPISSGYQLSF